jgi:hypothetical protein
VPRGEDTRGEDTRGEDTRGEDTRGEDTRGEDPRGEVPRGDPGLHDILPPPPPSTPVWSPPMGRLLNQQGASRLSHLLTPSGKHVHTVLRTGARVTGRRVVAGLLEHVCRTPTSILYTPIRAGLEMAKTPINIAIGTLGTTSRPAEVVVEIFGDGSVHGLRTGEARGTFASTWNLYLCLHLEPPPGTSTWNLHLEPPPGKWAASGERCGGGLACPCTPHTASCTPCWPP